MSFVKILEKELVFPEDSFDTNDSIVKTYIRLFLINDQNHGYNGLCNVLTMAYISNLRDVTLIHDLVKRLIFTGVESVQNGPDGKHTSRKFNGSFIDYEEFFTDYGHLNDTRLDKLLNNLCEETMVTPNYLLYSLKKYIEYNRDKSENGGEFDIPEDFQIYKKGFFLKDDSYRKSKVVLHRLDEDGVLIGKNKYYFRENRLASMRESISADETTSDKTVDLDSYIVWDTDENAKNLRSKEYSREELRISALSAWKLYDTHKIFGKHSFLDIICTRVSYLANIEEEIDLNDNTDDTPVDFTLEANQILIGARAKRKKNIQKEKTEVIKGLGTACLNMMLISSYNKGYKRIVLTVNKSTRKKSVEETTLRFYKRKGFFIIGEMADHDYENGKEVGQPSIYYIMVKSMKRIDYENIIRETLRFVDLNEVLKKYPELSNFIEELEQEKKESGIELEDKD